MIEQIYNLYKDDIKAIYYVGSKTIPFLEDIAKDLDYVIWLKDKNKKVEIKNKVQELGLFNIASVFFVFDTDEIIIRPYSFQNHYTQKLFGKFSYTRYELDVLDYKNEYYNLLKEQLYVELLMRKKTLYYYVMGMYLLKNNSYDFTEEQISNIKNAHNLNISDELVDELKDFFGLQVNYDMPQENLMTEKDKQILAIKNEIKGLKNELAETDYKAIKYFEGYYSEEEYAPIKAHRQELRDRINQLLSELQEK